MKIELKVYDKVSDIMYNHESLLRYIQEANESQIDIFKDNRFCVLLYTGIKTKDGDIVCEGDILETADSKVNKILYLVKRNELGDMVIEPFYKRRYGLIPVKNSSEYLLSDMESNRTLKIMGNVYENRKLLGGKYEI